MLLPTAVVQSSVALQDLLSHPQTILPHAINNHPEPPKSCLTPFRSLLTVSQQIYVIQPSEPQEFLYKSRIQAPGK